MKKQELKVFDNKHVRTVWDDAAEKWYFSVVDVVAVLTDSDNPRNYWKVLKSRLKKEGNQTVTNCNRLKLRAEDGKMRITDVADQEQLFRLIQSIPSPNAEPFKLWMAHVASVRLEQAQNPELSIEQAVADYSRLGYSKEWIKKRLQTILVRKELTDEWKRAGVEEGKEFALLTDVLTQTWSGLTTRQYKDVKRLRKGESLRDNMTMIELALNMLGEAATTEISKAENPRGFAESETVARKGGAIARNARVQIEKQTGHSVVTSERPPRALPNPPKQIT